MSSDYPQAILDEPGRQILARHADWWERKGMLCAHVPHSPLADLWLPLSDGSTALDDLDLHPHMLDLDRLAGPCLESGPLAFIEDCLATAAPYVRVPWVEAVLGCPVRATIRGGSMRTKAFVADWAEWERGRPHLDRGWLDALNRLTELLAIRSGGQYAVVPTLMRGPSDLAEAVLGPRLMCLSIYDHPQAMRSFLDETTDAFVSILQAQLGRIPPIEGGFASAFGVWAPGSVGRTQCDASAFLSAEQYARWFLPYDVRISESVDFSIIHLHSGSLHTVDALLEVERPQAIQVTLDPLPSGPPLETMLPTFRKILASKPLIVDGTLSETEVRTVQDELPADGLYIRARQEP